MNSVELLGIVKEVCFDNKKRKFVIIEIERPFLEGYEVMTCDTFKIYRRGITGFLEFGIVDVGCQIVLRGHLENLEGENIVIAENYKILFFPKK